MNISEQWYINKQGRNSRTLPHHHFWTAYCNFVIVVWTQAYGFRYQSVYRSSAHHNKCTV